MINQMNPNVQKALAALHMVLLAFGSLIVGVIATPLVIVGYLFGLPITVTHASTVVRYRWFSRKVLLELE